MVAEVIEKASQQSLSRQEKIEKVKKLQEQFFSEDEIWKKTSPKVYRSFKLDEEDEMVEIESMKSAEAISDCDSLGGEFVMIKGAGQ